MNTHRQVGKNVANFPQLFADVGKLEYVCQLQSVSNQCLAALSANWQVGSAAKLPTSANPHGYWASRDFQVGENSPLPTGEVDTPDWTSGCLPCSRTCSMGCDPGVQVQVAQ